MSSPPIPASLLVGLGAVLGLLLAPGCATPSSWRPGASHVGLGVSHAFEFFDLDDAERDSGTTLDADGATGGEVRLGHRVLPRVELEFQGQYFEGFDIEADSGSSVTVDVESFGLAVKLYEDVHERWFPDLSERWSPYLTLGIAAVRARLDDPQGLLRGFEDSAVGGRAGLGLEAYVSRHVAWFVEGAVLEPFGNLGGLTLFTLTAGLQWRF